MYLGFYKDSGRNGDEHFGTYNASRRLLYDRPKSVVAIDNADLIDHRALQQILGLTVIREVREVKVIAARVKETTCSFAE